MNLIVVGDNDEHRTIISEIIRDVAGGAAAGRELIFARQATASQPPAILTGDFRLNLLLFQSNTAGRPSSLVARPENWPK